MGWNHISLQADHLIQHGSLARFIAWVRRGGYAILDQALFAGTNFLLKVLLARWLLQDQFGAFVVAFSVFLFLALLHESTLSGPLFVYGAGKYADHFSEYLGLLCYGHVAVTLLLGAGLIVGAILVEHTAAPYLAESILALGLALPAILLLWLLRRVCYVRTKPQWAAIGGALYLALVTGMMLIMARVGSLSAWLAVLIMGAASLVVSIGLLAALKPRWDWREYHLSVSAVLADHWSYGKWSLAKSGLSGISSNLYYTILPLWAGLEGSAALQAIMNFILPVQNVNMAMSLVLTPELVKAYHRGEKLALNRVVRIGLGLFLLVSAGYWLMLVVLHQPLVTWLYDGRYDAYADLLIPAGLIPLTGSVAAIIGGALCAMERFDRVFWSYAASAVVTLTLGLALLSGLGTTGAVLGLVLASITTGAVQFLLYLRHTPSAGRVYPPAPTPLAEDQSVV